MDISSTSPPSDGSTPQINISSTTILALNHVRMDLLGCYSTRRMITCLFAVPTLPSYSTTHILMANTNHHTNNKKKRKGTWPNPWYWTSTHLISSKVSVNYLFFIHISSFLWWLGLATTAFVISSNVHAYLGRILIPFSVLMNNPNEVNLSLPPTSLVDEFWIWNIYQYHDFCFFFWWTG